MKLRNGRTVHVTRIHQDGSFDGKHDKASVQYTAKASVVAEMCDKCEYFEKPRACQKVAGDISPRGWCELFEKA